MDPRACIDRLIGAIARGDAAEMVQATSDLLGFLIAMETMLARPVEREEIKIGLALLADRLEGMRIHHPGPSTCEDCGSDNCCRLMGGD